MTQPLKRKQKVTVTLQRWQWQHVTETIGMFIGNPETVGINYQILQRLQREK